MKVSDPASAAGTPPDTGASNIMGLVAYPEKQSESLVLYEGISANQYTRQR